ncbi:MAG TPA: FAD-dependent oxidoreductase [Ohtaekwangia sp.]|uniref:NAD(P)/FAD-dependent oxidoreductase n=1 Tax=Ohtaekwangia sp. TaxID=2066019 RepID=UPI002F92D337
MIVVGAGAFGGWSALYLLRQGYKVTLIDAWGAGNSRSSSGDETRVIRSTYGANEIYFDFNVRALTLWKENERLFNKKLFYNTGVLWFCYEGQTPLVDDSLPYATKHKMEYERLTRDDLKKRYPIIHTSDLHHAYFDSYGGYLKAREACQAVCEQFIKEGGEFIQAQVEPGGIDHQRLDRIKLSDGRSLQADIYLFACGSWLGKIFPDILQQVITCSKQEVFYFGVPAQHAAIFDSLPVWIDVDGKDFYYGIAGNAHRGFKIGVDIRGEVFDPTHGERTYTPDVLTKAREFIVHRFPLLKNAPLTESRVCPYENSPDGNFIFEVHPYASNLLLLGGGSGHGFKHGPALGEMVANTLAGIAIPPAIFRRKL